MSKENTLNGGEKGSQKKAVAVAETPQVEKQYTHAWKETGVRTELGAMNLNCSRCELSATSDTKDRQDELACKSNRRR